MNQLKALTKYLMSFFKRDWDVEDYPLRFFRQKGESTHESVPRHPMPWRVHIINWWLMRGFGASRDQALEDLRGNFKRYKERHGLLHRPGTNVPIEIEFEARTRVAVHEDLAMEFFPRVLGMEYGTILYLSDVSSLRDFGERTSVQDFQNRIWQVYGVDVSDIEDGNLAAIFERISKPDAA